MLRWFALCWLWLAASGAWAVADLVPLPALTARVTDQTGTLTSAQVAQLESALSELERAKGAQLVVLIAPTTQPESIEGYGIRLADAWKIGRKGVDDGVILIVAKNDRAVRIEVGYGLEGVIPDVVAKRIIEERIVPRFRAGDFFGGVQDAVQTLARLIDGEALPPPAGRADESGAAQDDWQAIALFVLAAAARMLRSLFGLLGALLAGGVAGALAWYFFGSGLAGLVAAVLIVGLAFAKGGGRGGGWSSGGGGYSGGGGGGFGGGGGGFGGGGASGRW
jgi:uncharacterized protein